MDILKYFIRNDYILIYHRRKVYRIMLPKNTEIQQLIKYICKNFNNISKENLKRNNSFSVYKVKRLIFKISNNEISSLKRYFPDGILLSEKEKEIIEQKIIILNYLNVPSYVKLDNNQNIIQIEEGISLCHVLDKPIIDFKLSEDNYYFDTSILKSIYFERIIHSFDIINYKCKLFLKIYTYEGEVYSFEGTSIDTVIYEAIKRVMELKLGYKNIGIGRNKKESYHDFFYKCGKYKNYIYCQDSLSKYLGLVLTRKGNL